MIGRSAVLSRTVTEADTAARFGDVFPPAASTPFVLGLAEVAAHTAVEEALEGGEITVGTSATIAHLAPSPVGTTLTATATVVAQDGRRLEFHIEVLDDRTEVVARIDHARAVVDRQRLLDRLANHGAAAASQRPKEAPAYRANVHVRRLGGLDKAVRLPAEPEETIMGGHAEVAEHYGAAGREPHPATLDYVVGATAACLAGTFATALRGRDITIGLDDYEVDACGEIFNRTGVLVIERIVVTHKVRLPEEHHATARRVLDIYERGCAVSRSIEGSIEIESRLEFV